MAIAEFSRFLKGTSALFPAANDTSGGQLLTEYNLISRYRVDGDMNAPFECGPSYTRGKDDFELSSSYSSVLKVAPGAAIVNGYFIRSELDIEFDMTDAGLSLLSGALAIGLKTKFSSEISTQDSIMTDSTSIYYTGLNFVIMPVSEVKLPSSAGSADEVTMDLLLGTFDYIGGSISNIVNNDNKVAYIDSARIKTASSDSEGSSAVYPPVPQYAPNQMYVLCPYQDNKGNWMYWENVSSKLLDWDKYNPDAGESTCSLIVPQVNPHDSINENDLRKVTISLPAADYEKGKAGVITKTIIDVIKQFQATSNDISSWLNPATSEENRMIAYLPYIDSIDQVISVKTDLEASDYGRYVLVGLDNTQSTLDGGRAPSTMYIVNKEAIVVEGQENPEWRYFISMEPVFLSAAIPYATPDIVGGFKSIDLEGDAAQYTDRGYIFLDAEGHLRLRDYALLRSGLLAYALTQDFEESESVTAAGLQESLDNYVNDRILMPKADGSKDISVTIPSITSESPETASIVTLRNIDARFGSTLHLHLESVSDANVGINIQSCERIIIYVSGTTRCSIYIEDSEVFYNLSLIQYSSLSFNNVKFWYDDSYDDVTGMADQHIYVDDTNTVYFDPVEGDRAWADLSSYYLSTSSLDYHVQYGPHHVKFDKNGQIEEIGLSFLGTFTSEYLEKVQSSLVVGDFYLPSVPNFTIPVGRLYSRLSFSGDLNTVYQTDDVYTFIHSEMSAFCGEGDIKGAITQKVDVSQFSNTASSAGVRMLYGSISEGTDLSELYPGVSVIVGRKRSNRA